MNQPGSESGTELVLDSRKLIVGFLLLIAACGAFFVIGFMEGKRQAVQAPGERVSPSSSPGTGEPVAGAESKPPGTAKPGSPATDRSVREQLDWYKNVQGSGSEPPKASETAGAAKGVAATESRKPVETKAPPPKAGPARETSTAVPAANATYAVQVGAFRQRREAEARMAAVKSKGYACVIEPPRSADQLYLIKVGRFNTRADAKAMQLRLQKDGFPSIIKVN